MADEKKRDTRTFGRVVRDRRIELGLTQEELAERVGESIRQSDISRMEHDYVMLPRRDRLEALAAALEISAGQLLMHSGWITSEESASMEPAATSRASAPAEAASPDDETTPKETAALVDASMEPEGQESRHLPSGLDDAMAHAQEVSRDTEEILRRTASTMQNARRSRRQSR